VTAGRDPDLADIRAALRDAYDLLLEAHASREAVLAGDLPAVSLTDVAALEALEDVCREALARLKRREEELTRAQRARSRGPAGRRRKAACPGCGKGLG
jgi:uncharacterized membrane protein YccC